MERVRGMFSESDSRATWLRIEPLAYSAVALLTARVLRQNKEAAGPLARLVHSLSGGNPFATRNVLIMLHRQKLVCFYHIPVQSWNR